MHPAFRGVDKLASVAPSASANRPILVFFHSCPSGETLPNAIERDDRKAKTKGISKTAREGRTTDSGGRLFHFPPAFISCSFFFRSLSSDLVSRSFFFSLQLLLFLHPCFFFFLLSIGGSRTWHGHFHFLIVERSRRSPPQSEKCPVRCQCSDSKHSSHCFDY